MDICIPSKCSREDVQSILQWAVRDPYRAEVKFCKVRDEKVYFSTSQIICIISISIFIIWVFTGTILDILLTLNIINVPDGKGHILHNFVSVSLITSTRKLFSTDSDRKTRFLCGIKFLLVCLVVNAHIIIYTTFTYTTTEELKNFPILSANASLEIMSQGLSMIEIFFFLRWPRIVTVLLYILTVAGIVSHVSQSLIQKCFVIVGLAVNLKNVVKLLMKIYIKPYFSHLSSYCLGLLIGHILLETKQLKLGKSMTYQRHLQ
ncbi:nose resistant to fluoxetine protein 6-like [Centruroides vittatus]|uniref:nose resistant to fluoxetine protein 6-like n=1 Tax=Centruroides vittatus TaxID=120091 RepID=UPI00350EC016